MRGEALARILRIGLIRWEGGASLRRSACAFALDSARLPSAGSPLALRLLSPLFRFERSRKGMRSCAAPLGAPARPAPSLAARGLGKRAPRSGMRNRFSIRAQQGLPDGTKGLA